MHGELPDTLRETTTGRWPRIVAAVLVVAGAAAVLAYFFAGPAQQQSRARFPANGPVPVLAAAVTRADVPVYLSAVGTVRANNTVTIRPQVEGKLIAIKFKEGEDVKKGDVLAEIDPVTYKAALDQVRAKKAQNEALLANGRNDLERYESLARSNAINKQQVDTQRALVAQYTAQVQADQAAVESAEATLSYTKIVAPIAGRTGIRLVDEGNIVRPTDATGIVVITQIKPISILFNLPQQNLDAVNAAFAERPLPADALRADTGEVIGRGKLIVVDNQVDAATGTVRLKAEFPNERLRLWPGQFVNVRLLIDTLKQVAVIPTGAVQRGPAGTFVYVANDDGTASVRPIQVQMQDEKQTVVASGLTPPARVVTTGFARLTDGARISISTESAPGAGGPVTRPRPNAPPSGAGAQRVPRQRNEASAGGPNPPR